MQARKIENTIKGYPEYEQICQRECNGECQEILSFATFVHTSKESYLTGNLELTDECAPRHSICMTRAHRRLFCEGGFVNIAHDQHALMG